MKTVKGYSASSTVLTRWSKSFVPDFNLFYFKEKPLYLSVCSIEDLNQSLLTLDVKTTFETWNVDKEARLVSVVSDKEFSQLPSEIKREILSVQKKLNRGFIFSKSEIVELLRGLDQETIQQSLELLSDACGQDDIFTIQKASWNQFSNTVRKTILLNYAVLWIVEHALDETIKEAYKEDYPALYPYMNTFSSINGANCFAAAISAIKNSDDTILEWMQTDTFEDHLKEQQYEQVKEKEPKTHDVLVWKNEQNTPVHGAFMLSDKHAFNKHGQTMYNPWQILRKEELLDAWSGFNYSIYRKV